MSHLWERAGHNLELTKFGSGSEVVPRCIQNSGVEIRTVVYVNVIHSFVLPLKSMHELANLARAGYTYRFARVMIILLRMC